MPIYNKIKNKSESFFRRIVGVKKHTFNEMVKIVSDSKNSKTGRKRSGRKPDLCIEDEILMTLEYLREYRTYAHIATDFGIHESNCCRGVKKIEDILIKSGKFNLPKRKELTSNLEIEAILVDVTEQPIERPKKKRFKNGEKNQEQKE